MEEAIKLPEMKNQGLSDDELRAVLEPLMSPERLSESFSKDIQVLLWPFGLELEPGYEYQQSSQTAIGESLIPIENTYYMAPQEEGQDYTEIFLDSQFDSDALKPFLTSFMADLMSKVEDKGQYDEEEFKSGMANCEMVIVDSFGAAIDDSTTRPFVSTYTRTAVVLEGEKVQGRIQTRTIRLQD